MEIQGLKQNIMEDYKSEYEAALARAKAVCLTDDDKKGAMETVFPELMELDKDDEIRQALIKYFTLWGKDASHTWGIKNEDIVDWLKRVKSVRVKSAKVTTGKLAEMIEQKALEDMKRINPWTLTIGLSRQEMTEKSEQDKPKFKVGNWYQCTKDFFGKGVTFDKDTAYYCAKEGCLQNQYGCHIAIVKELYDYFKLWTIQDVKNGDVLAGKIDGDDYILIFKQIKDGWVETYGHYYDAVDRFCVPSQLFCRDYKGTLHPATKEQRDILFQKMHEAGYEWDSEKKELSHKEVTKKSEQECTEKDIQMINILCSIFEVSNGYYKVDRPGQYAIRAEEILDWLKQFKKKLL